MAQLPDLEVKVKVTVEPEPPKRRGRLKVISDGRFENTEVFVVTDDGEEIELPVNAVAVRSEVGEPFYVDLTAYALEVDVAEWPVLHGVKRIQARSSNPPRPAVFPELELTPPSSWTSAVRWAVSFLEPIAKIFVSAIPPPPPGHQCPYQVDVKNNPGFRCSCDEAATRECARDI